MPEYLVIFHAFDDEDGRLLASFERIVNPQYIRDLVFESEHAEIAHSFKNDGIIASVVTHAVVKL